MKEPLCIFVSGELARHFLAHGTSRNQVFNLVEGLVLVGFQLLHSLERFLGACTYICVCACVRACIRVCAYMA